MRKIIPIEVKIECCRLVEEGVSTKDIYNDYYKLNVDNPASLETFRRSLRNWKKATFPDNTTLKGGTYEGFIAHGATVQVSKDGEIIQAWIKQKADDINLDDFLDAVRENVDPYEHTPHKHEKSFNMLEIPLFDMHWGIAFFDYYKPMLDSVLDLIRSHSWKRIVIPFGQDFFHNDSIVNGQTTRGTNIEKVDMTKAVKEGRRFIYAIIDAAIESADEVSVLYTAGNHDRSISWMFTQVLLERYGPSIVDDSLDYRKVVTFGNNAIMFTHGDSKIATAKNLAQLFPISFAKEFACASIREIHAGHLHHEAEADIHGVMVRRLSTGNKTDDWHDREDYIGAHKRFMLFDWGFDKLESIHYI